jgi:hypothetical protein
MPRPPRDRRAATISVRDHLATALGRSYDNFGVFVPTAEAALFVNEQLENPRREVGA